MKHASTCGDVLVLIAYLGNRVLGNKNNIVLCIFYDFRSLIKHRHVDIHKQ